MQSVTAVYALGDLLGSGKFAKIYRATHLATGRIVAVKLATAFAEHSGASIEERFQPLSVLIREHEAMLVTAGGEAARDAPASSSTCIPFVVSLADPVLYSGGSSDALALVLELATCDLLAYVSAPRLSSHGVPEALARFVVFRLLATLRALHAAGYVHRDVKPQNILIFETVHDDGNSGSGDVLLSIESKLADLGLAKLVDGCMARANSAGDWSIMAPDVAFHTDTRRVVTPEQAKKSDVYAVGMTLFFLLTGTSPFVQGDNRQELGDDYPFTCARNEAFVQRAAARCPAGIELAKTMLKYRHHERPSAEGALQDTWFCGLAVTGASSDSGSPAAGGSSLVDSRPLELRFPGATAAAATAALSEEDQMRVQSTSSLTEQDFQTSSPTEVVDGGDSQPLDSQ
jgi:serine/threonine protein kinase